MRTIFLYCAFILTGFAVAQYAYGQKVITGKVTSDSTKFLAGVTVTIQNSQVSTITDSNGNYAISAGEGAVLLFTLSGYQTTEVPVNGRNIIDVNLEKAVLAPLLPEANIYPLKNRSAALRFTYLK